MVWSFVSCCCIHKLLICRIVSSIGFLDSSRRMITKFVDRELMCKTNKNLGQSFLVYSEIVGKGMYHAILAKNLSPLADKC